MRNIDVAALRAIFDLVQHHYPEHLAMMWFLNAPFIFRGAWKGISPFIQPATKAKIEFLSGDHGRTVLQDNISLQVQPRAPHPLPCHVRVAWAWTVGLTVTFGHACPTALNLGTFHSLSACS